MKDEKKGKREKMSEADRRFPVGMLWRSVLGSAFVVEVEAGGVYLVKYALVPVVRKTTHAEIVEQLQVANWTDGQVESALNELKPVLRCLGCGHRQPDGSRMVDRDFCTDSCQLTWHVAMEQYTPSGGNRDDRPWARRHRKASSQRRDAAEPVGLDAVAGLVGKRSLRGNQGVW